MQTGKTYVKGNRWYFRYQEPFVDGQRAWRDTISISRRASSSRLRVPSRNSSVRQSTMRWARRTP